MRTILLLFLPLTALGCGYSGQKQMTQSGIVPVVAAIMPASQMHGGSDFMLTVTGSNFNGNAVVNWNAAPQSTTTHPMANTLSVMIPAADIATTGMAQVSVTNPGSSTPGGPYGGCSHTTSQTSHRHPVTV